MVSPVSFGALRAFVEVGRQGSIKRAAHVLNVTPGAVSQQIRTLEARFDVTLLERGNRSIKLSPDGLRLFGKIAPGFEQIDSAVALFGDRRTRPLVITTTPSFAACWLTPRLSRFTTRHPEIEVQIGTSAQLVDMANGMADIAIRHGSGKYPGLDSKPLFRPRLIVVASPEILVNGPPASPADCLRYPLLQDRDRADWSFWLDAHGVAPTRNATKGPGYADDALLIQAAIAGQGLAVVRDIYAANALKAGSLALAIDAPVDLSAGYFAVVRPDKARRPGSAAFMQWLLNEAREQ
ncbi:LysR family transcriptional regulator [Martelella lutilitoris]|uniref:LysR family transcriptional regulator n=1 Tax=Martelella lutilitoris TaxID=2583532 RepID=A0A5C4JSV0_9HYPH|nr:LysR substrate-binding domain-containing protein [Martelella lutilitoris]TNB48251.1 LysR family transcriptional regulator [Martelella lutilitoris]